MTGHSELGKLELRPGDVELSGEQLQRTPLFANASEAALRRLGSLRSKGAVVLRHFRAGDVICRQGEPGWTAFYILRDADIRRLGVAPDSTADDGESESGPASISMDRLMLSVAGGHRVKAEVSITPARSLRPPQQGGLGSRIVSLLSRRERPRNAPVDASANVVVSSHGAAVGFLREGELFGEMSCFNHTPRSATVRVTEDCYMLELMRNVLDDALHNQDFREALNQIYRKRVLETHLASLAIFENAPPGALAELGRRAELVTHYPGAIIFREGEEADAMYFVRHGTVKLYREGSDGRVLGYRSRGEWVGGGSLMAGERRRMNAAAYAPARSAALAHASPSARESLAARVELVRISRELFHDVCQLYPELDGAARRQVAERSLHSTRPEAGSAVESLAGSLGLSQGEQLMLIDLDHCTRCGDCVRACADSHGGTARLTRSGPRFGSYLVPGTCRQCLDPVCLLGCPVGSIHRGSSAEIVIEDWCIGCGLCAEQCPYDAISLSDAVPGETRKAHVCDQCSTLDVAQPLCVHACAHDAAHRVDGRSFFTDWDKRS